MYLEKSFFPAQAINGVDVDEISNLILLATDIGADPGKRLAAFGELVTRFQGMAYGYAYSILGDFHLAEDAAQDAFVMAFQKLNGLRDPKAFPGWLRRIVRTACHRPGTPIIRLAIPSN